MPLLPVGISPQNILVFSDMCITVPMLCLCGRQIVFNGKRVSHDRAGSRGVIYEGGGGGGTSSRRLGPSGASRERGEEALAHWRGVRGFSPGFFFKIYVSENAFQAILKPFFPYSITSVLSKVRHSNPRGVLRYFHTYVGASYFWGFKILNFDIFWGFQKNEYAFGYEDFVDIFGGHQKIGLYLGVISMHFRVFS